MGRIRAKSFVEGMDDIKMLGIPGSMLCLCRIIYKFYCITLRNVLYRNFWSGLWIILENQSDL
jgi:hypothetical protein